MVAFHVELFPSSSLTESEWFIVPPLGKTHGAVEVVARVGEARERFPERITTEYVRACDNWELLVDRTIERTIESTQTCARWERFVAYYSDFDRNREAMHREWEARGWVNF